MKAKETIKDALCAFTIIVLVLIIAVTVVPTS
jgi:hypothetical protein